MLSIKKKIFKNKIFKSTKVIALDVSKIIPWKYSDRPENEFGDIRELAETFKTIGQQQPCIVRKFNNKNKYELIVGERRYRAAKMLGIKLKVIVKTIDNKKASLIQFLENEKRKNISEFAKGISFYSKIKKNLITQQDLTHMLGISKQQVTRLLSYKKIDKRLYNKIKDFRKVSSRTAYELYRFSNKGKMYVDALMDMSDKIKNGEYGQRRIEKALNKRFYKNKIKIPVKREIVNYSGRKLFTCKLNNYSTLSLFFPKNIVKNLNKNVENYRNLLYTIKNFMIDKNII